MSTRARICHHEVQQYAGLLPQFSHARRADFATFLIVDRGLSMAFYCVGCFRSFSFVSIKNLLMLGIAVMFFQTGFAADFNEISEKGIQIQVRPSSDENQPQAQRKVPRFSVDPQQNSMRTLIFPSTGSPSSLASQLENSVLLTSDQIGMQQIQSFHVLGAETSHTAIVLDGSVLRDPTSPLGYMSLQDLPSSWVSSAQVLLPRESVMYGNHPGGALLLQSFAAKSDYHSKVDLSVSTPKNLAGAFATHFDWMGKSSAISAYAKNLSAESIANKNSPDAEHDLQNMAGFQWQVDWDDEQSLQFLFFQRNSDIDGYGVQPTDDPNATSRNKYFLMSYKKINSSDLQTSWKNQLDFFSTERQYQDEWDVENPYPYNGKFSSQTLSWTMNYLGPDRTQVQTVLGVESMRADEYSDSQSTSQNFLSGTLLKSFVLQQDQALQFFIQGQAQDQMKDASAGFSWMQSDWIFNFQKSIRFPSMYQRTSIFGSKDLDAEKSYNLSAEYKSEVAGISTEQLFFYQDIFDLLTFKVVNNKTQYINQDKARVIGWVQSWGPKEQQLKISLMKAYDPKTDLELLRRPTTILQGNRDFQVFSGTLQIQARWKSSNQDVNGSAARVSLPSSQRWDLRWSRHDQGFAGLKQVCTSLGVENIFRQRQEDVWAYPWNNSTWSVSVQGVW